MSEFSLTPKRVSEGIWEGVIQGGGGSGPDIEVTHLGLALEGVRLTQDPAPGKRWHLSIPIPVDALSNGVQTFLIRERGGDQHLGSFSIALGDVLEGDIRAEVDLLRAELDMLKRAFRRHCVETS